MAHPLIPQITDIANPIAAELGLEVVAVAFHTHERPPSLRIDIRNPTEDTGLQDCERMSRALEAALDATEVIPFEYALEVSSPGTSRELTTDREFNAFSGFAVQVTAKDSADGKPQCKEISFVGMKPPSIWTKKDEWLKSPESQSRKFH